MSKEFNKYSSIGQYRNALKCMAYHNIEQMLCIGSVKLHGTNAAIRFTCGADDSVNVSFQSRNRDITIEDDNAGFANYMQTFVDDESIANILPESVFGDLIVWGYTDDVIVYGEFAGEGIMKGVGINNLPKSFFIFDVKIDGKYISAIDVAKFGLQLQKYNIYNIYSFPTFFQIVKTDTPMDAQAVFAALTQQVEDECPVAYALCDNDGKPLVGEGLVWKPVDVKYRQISDLCFKTKGDKHSASKVKTIAEVTPEMLAKEKAVDEFVNIVVTENRLRQGVE